jgi:hypothetical protein
MRRWKCNTSLTGGRVVGPTASLGGKKKVLLEGQTSHEFLIPPPPLKRMVENISAQGTYRTRLHNAEHLYAEIIYFPRRGVKVPANL